MPCVERWLDSIPELVVHRPATMAEVVDRGTSRERFVLVLMGAFAVIALALAALGLSTVCSPTPCASVRRRLASASRSGRPPDRSARCVFRQAAVVVSLGVAAGLAGALWCLDDGSKHSRSASRASDPRILIGSVVVLTLVALVAAWLPAQRATRVAPGIVMQGGE